MVIEKIELIGGVDREGEKGPVSQVTFQMGKVASAIRPTGLPAKQPS